MAKLRRLVAYGFALSVMIYAWAYLTAPKPNFVHRDGKGNLAQFFTDEKGELKEAIITYADLHQKMYTAEYYANRQEWRNLLELLERAKLQTAAENEIKKLSLK